MTTYSITFTDATTDATVAQGSFTYDSTVPAFSDFTVTDSVTSLSVDFTNAANNAIDIQGTGCDGTPTSAAGYYADPAATFALLNHACAGQTGPTLYQSQISRSSAIGIDFHEEDSASPPDETSLETGTFVARDPGAYEDLNWSVAPVPPVSTPEPSAVITLLTYLGVLALAVKGPLARGLRQATKSNRC